MYHTDPIALQEKAYIDVVELYADVRKMQIREKQKDKKVVRRRASDDAGWW